MVLQKPRLSTEAGTATLSPSTGPIASPKSARCRETSRCTELGLALSRRCCRASIGTMKINKTPRLLGLTWLNIVTFKKDSTTLPCFPKYISYNVVQVRTPGPGQSSMKSRSLDLKFKAATPGHAKSVNLQLSPCLSEVAAKHK